MDYDNETGLYIFKGYEESWIFIYLWEQMLCNMSFWGRVELIWRILLSKPPKKYFEEKENLKNVT